MKLYAIQIRHCSPKDCKESIVRYVIANKEEDILNYIDEKYMSGIWTDRNDDSLSNPLTIYDDDYNKIGVETHNEKMLRLRGDFNDKNADYSDAYYGVTHYGWTEGKDVTTEEIEILIRLGVAIDLR